MHMQQAPVRSQALVYGCLVLSGSTSLVYELLWTRILSFSFGSTSLAFAAVLAVFFLGLAGGSLLGGRAARRLSDPLRAYGWLELAIGLYAGAAFPFLFKLHHLFALHNAGGAEPSGLAFRFAAAAAVLALPTLCMGATFPVLFEHLRRERSHLTEALGRLYGINTLGAFLGVYLATHWLIPFLGLDKANYVAVALNVLVFALSRLRLPASRPAAASATASAEASVAAATPAEAQAGAAAMPPPAASPRLAFVGLLLLSASGFITLAYEVVWGRVLTISMEGSLYGIGATLGSFLAGIGLGGLAFSLLARRLQGPSAMFRAYVLVCLAVVAYLALSRLLLPVEGYLLRSVTQGVRGLLGLHLNFAIAVIFLLPVTAGLGFMFPAAVSLYVAGRANPAEGAGKAYALNTAMSVAGSILSASFLMDLLGIEGIVFLGVHVMLLTLLAAVLLAEAGKPDRRLWLALAALPPLLAAAWWPSIDAKTVLVGAVDGKPPSLSQAFQSLAVQFAPRNSLKIYKDGVGSTLAVSVNGRTASVLSNGLPQSGRAMDPPHYNLESILVGLLPAMHRPDAGNALVVGLGAGISVDVLRRAGVPSVEVVELEPAMANICRSIHPKGESPLDDTGVTLRQDDARNFLVRNGYRADRRRWDIIASQPAHPWVSGAADLFTEEMFRLAYDNLSEDGVFCQWFMPSGIDEAAFAALANAFGNVFDRALVYRTYGSFSGIYFIGTRGGSRFSAAGAEAVFGRPGLRQLLDLHRHPRPEDVFKYSIIGLSDGASLRFPGRPVNRDRNAFVETRMPLLPKGKPLPLEGVPGKALTGPLPAGFQGAGAGDTLFVFRAIDALSGNILSPVTTGKPDSLQIARLRLYRTNAPPPFREYYGAHLALASGAPPAWLDTAAGRALAAGQSLLSAQFRLLRLRLGPASPSGHLLPEGLPPDFLRDFLSQQALYAALAAAASPAVSSQAAARAADSVAALPGVDPLFRDMAMVMKAHRLRDTGAAALDDRQLEAVYRKATTAWIHWEAGGEALEWYCANRGRKVWALMTRRGLDGQREQRAKRSLDAGLRLKNAGKRKEALAAFSRARELDPALQNAYLGEAEIYGLAKDKAAYDSLVAGIRRDFPMPDVVLHRVREAYLLKPDARADSTDGGE